MSHFEKNHPKEIPSDSTLGFLIVNDTDILLLISKFKKCEYNDIWWYEYKFKKNLQYLCILPKFV